MNRTEYRAPFVVEAEWTDAAGTHRKTYHVGECYRASVHTRGGAVITPHNRAAERGESCAHCGVRFGARERGKA